MVALEPIPIINIPGLG